MEFKEHLNILNKGKFIIIILTVLITLASFLFAYFKPVSYVSSISFSVNRINKQETSDYQFDGYYAIQASDLFSQTVISWFLTPSVLLEIYDQAGVDPKIKSLDKFASRFKTKKYSAQNIVVTFREPSQEGAQKLSQTIIEVIEEKAVKLNQTADNKALFEIMGSKPVIVASKPNTLLVTLIGFISGLIISIIGVYLIRYFKEDSEELVPKD